MLISTSHAINSKISSKKHPNTQKNDLNGEYEPFLRNYNHFNQHTLITQLLLKVSIRSKLPNSLLKCVYCSKSSIKTRMALFLAKNSRKRLLHIPSLTTGNSKISPTTLMPRERAMPISIPLPVSLQKEIRNPKIPLSRSSRRRAIQIGHLPNEATSKTPMLTVHSLLLSV